MPDLEFADDAAAEQLYDELFARGWSLHLLLPHLVPSPESRALRYALFERACLTVERIRQHPPGNGSVPDVSSVLWPGSGPPTPEDPWWGTPLGRLLRPSTHAGDGGAVSG